MTILTNCRDIFFLLIIQSVLLWYMTEKNNNKKKEDYPQPSSYIFVYGCSSET
jgi:hypothetical protein